MDARTFDALARSLRETGSRRGLLGLLAALPLLGGLVSLLNEDEVDAKGRRKRRKKPHHHRKHTGNHNHKKKHKKKCMVHSTATTCAGKCGQVKNNCKKIVDCGSCVCDPPCPACQTCDESTGTCVPNDDVVGDACGSCHTCNAAGACVAAENNTPCDDGNACTQIDTCQGGVCVGSDPVVCDDPPECHTSSGTCNPITGECSYDAASAGTICDSVTCGECDGAGNCVSTGTLCGSGECCDDETHVCYQSVCAIKCPAPSFACPPGSSECFQVPFQGQSVFICLCAFEGTCPCDDFPDTCPQGSACVHESCDVGGGCYEICAST